MDRRSTASDAKLGLLPTLGLALGVALLLALLETTEDSLARVGLPWADPFGLRLIGVLPPWLLRALLIPLVVMVVRLFPLQRPRLLRAAMVHAGAASLYAGLHLALLAIYVHWRFGAAAPFGTDLRLLLSNYFVVDVILYGGSAVAIAFADAAAVRRRLERATLELRAEVSAAHLDALRHQLSPHFIGNVLNTAAMLIRQDAGADAIEMLTGLAELLRHLTEATGHEVTVGEELAFLERYLALEQVRFHDRLQVSVHAPGDCAHAFVPGLILQPVVENALQHGVGRRGGPANVGVSVRRQRDSLVLEVRDDGVGLPDGWTLRERAGVGLHNTMARLEELYGAAQQFSLVSRPGGGVIAEIVLPFHTVPCQASPR